jgi:hypothetical protein
MVKYELGKIYKIIDNTNGNIYIGSTCSLRLAQRLVEHRSKYKAYVETSVGFNLASFDIIKNGDYKIILIEDFPCENKDQLRAREQYWIENTECVNKHRALLTSEHVKQDNKTCYEKYKEKRIQNQKEYYQKNRDNVLEQKRQYYQRKKLKLQEQEEAKSES